MKKLLCLLSMIAFLMGCGTTNVGRIKVKGNKFVDARGKEIIFRGLCFADAHDVDRQGHWDERLFNEAKSWGANIVRFAVHPSSLRTREREAYFTLLDHGIEMAKKAGLYVIIDWHSIGNLKDEKFTGRSYDTSIEETFRFWADVAKRYKNEPTVAMYELFNEPTVSGRDLGTCTWEEWKALCERLIDTIRAYNPKALCLVSGFDWAYELRNVGASPIGRNNIAYVSHPYPMKRPEPWPEKWDADFGYVAKTYPVICTELGYCLEGERGAHVPVIATDDYGVKITKYFEERGISFTLWCFHQSWAPTLFSDWNFTPTTQGRFFKRYLQQFIKN